MKDKLHALIAEQKALTAKFEELVNETNYAFIGDKDRAEDIKTFLNSTLDCERRDCIYFHNIKTNLPDVYLMGSLAATHKHFEDYTIVDLKCEPDFFKKHSNSEIPNNLDPKKVYIKGHPTRGAEVIKMLEDLGGVNKFNWDGTRSWIIYRIRHEDNVILSTAIEDLRYTPCNIELHLPEEESAENAQTTDIKVGDWIWVDKIEGYCIARSEIYATNPHQVQHITNYQKWISNHHFVDESLGDKFHKVDPPKEEVELIEGEVYVCIKGKIELPFIYNGKNDNEIKYLVGLDFKGHLNYSYQLDTIRHKYKYRLATPEQRKQLFDALEKANKYFDRVNMRLLDVAEWSGEKGLPIIVRNDTTNWRADIFHSYDAVDAKYPFLCATCDEEGHPYKYAIPYDKTNADLIGTTDSPNKHYKFVENGE